MIWYLALLGLTALLSRLLPRRWYIWTAAAIQGLFAALRHPHLTGDLMKYHWLFLSGQPLTDWENPGFSLLMYGFSGVSRGNYQLFLAILAFVSAFAVGWALDRFSEKPWLGFWVWNCLGFYLGTFSAIKQALAMALVLLAYGGLEDGKRNQFLILTLLAGLIHLPALIFLPAFCLTRFRFDGKTATVYLLLGAAIWGFRQEAVLLLSRWYPAELTGGAAVPGGRFFLMVLILATGIALRGTEDATFSRLTHLMACAALLQLLAVYGNVFTRLADYYFQFALLFIPNMFAQPGRALLPFREGSRRALRGLAAVCLLVFYVTACLNVEIVGGTDNYVNYQFYWETREEGL